MPLSKALDVIQHAQHVSGGFPHRQDGQPRADATAWAIIALSAWNSAQAQCDKARLFLTSLQLDDGRIPISPNHPEVIWPTSLAVLAWHGNPNFQEAQNRAVNFLLGFTGRHFSKPDGMTVGHDPAILGWPWIAETHSWVIPTGLTIMALTLAGHQLHERVLEGGRMILDRQLLSGGWNYGNTLAFGKELHPLPECTGLALQTLARQTRIKNVQKSLDYISDTFSTLHTPISLGWALLGLEAWGLRPANADQQIAESFIRQKRYGTYSLPALALLLCAAKGRDGFYPLFANSAASSDHLSSSFSSSNETRAAS